MSDPFEPLIPGVNMPDADAIRAEWAAQAARNIATDAARWRMLRGRASTQANRYQARKAAHQCVRCGRSVENGAVRCNACAADQRERLRAKGWYNRQ